MKTIGNEDKIGWAFGLGLERIAMVLFDIPDIRQFWSTDERFLSQFKSGQITTFQPYSKYPSCYKDVSFWCLEDVHDNDVFEVVRDVAGDLAENVTLVSTMQPRLS
jgi:phenylalanyl-tRNA synthetase alpha chain